MCSSVWMTRDAAEFNSEGDGKRAPEGVAKLVQDETAASKTPQ